MKMLYCGLSAVGKDFLLSQAESEIERNDITVVNFGEMLLSEVAGNTAIVDRDNLCSINEELKDVAITRCLRRIAKIGSSVIVNSHLIVPNLDSFSSDMKSIKRLAPSFIGCVIADPESIHERSKSDETRNRTVVDVSLLHELQSIQKEIVVNLSDELDVGYSFIDNSSGNTEAAVCQLKRTIEEQVS